MLTLCELQLLEGQLPWMGIVRRAVAHGVIICRAITQGDSPSTTYYLAELTNLRKFYRR